MMNTKLTKKDKFNMAIELVASTDSTNKEMLIEFFQHELELLEKKNSKSGGQTKLQKENEILLDQLETALAEFDSPTTITDFMKKSTHEVATLSNQKLSALMKKLVEDRHTVVKTVEKKKSYFYLIR